MGSVRGISQAALHLGAVILAKGTGADVAVSSELHHLRLPPADVLIAKLRAELAREVILLEPEREEELLVGVAVRPVLRYLPSELVVVQVQLGKLQAAQRGVNGGDGSSQLVVVQVDPPELPVID